MCRISAGSQRALRKGQLMTRKTGPRCRKCQQKVIQCQVRVVLRAVQKNRWISIPLFQPLLALANATSACQSASLVDHFDQCWKISRTVWCRYLFCPDNMVYFTLPILTIPPLFSATHHHVQISVPLTIELMIVLMTPSALCSFGE